MLFKVIIYKRCASYNQLTHFLVLSDYLSFMEYTATQIPFFGEVPETGLPFLCTCGR